MDRVELRALVERYAAGADRRDGEMVASCFAPDGVNVVPKVPESLAPTIVREGREAIASTIPRLARYYCTMHAVVGQVLEPGDGPDRATGVVSCLAHHVERQDGELIDLAWSLRYHDAYVRLDGEWLIARRELWCDFVERRPVRYLRTDLDTDGDSTDGGR